MADLNDLRAKIKKPRVAVISREEPMLDVVRPVLQAVTRELQKPEPKRRQVLLAPNKKLTTKCKPVKEVTDDIRRLAQEMEDFLRNPPHMKVKPIGIAAPQLGECVRMFTGMFNPWAKEDGDSQITTVINPELVYQKKLHLVTESCLSLPDRFFQLKRPKLVKIKGMLLTGQHKSFKEHDLIAQMFMHELDHLDGLLLNVTGEVNRG